MMKRSALEISQFSSRRAKLARTLGQLGGEGGIIGVETLVDELFPFETVQQKPGRPVSRSTAWMMSIREKAAAKTTKLGKAPV